MSTLTPSDRHEDAPARQRIRVVHVVKGLGPGGAERLIANQLHSADTNAFDYSVVRLIPEKDHLVAEIEGLGIEVGLVGNGISWPLALRKNLRQQNPHVVHSHSPLVAAAVRLLARFGGVHAAVVTTEHNRWPRHHWATRLLNRATARFDNANISVSGDVRDSMGKSSGRRSRVLRHGVLVDKIGEQRSRRDAMRKQLDVSGVVVGIVANFRPEKAYDVFLAAVVLALERNPNLRFIVVGQGPGEEAFRHDVADAGLDSNVLVTGYRSDATAVMAAFDIFTLSSRHEGLPVALMEALALGIPTVATVAGGIAEAITDNVEGRLVAIDDPAGLAAGWLELASSPDIRSRMGQAALLRSASFDSAVSTTEIESTYRRVLRSEG